MSACFKTSSAECLKSSAACSYCNTAHAVSISHDTFAVCTLCSFVSKQRFTRTFSVSSQQLPKKGNMRIGTEIVKQCIRFAIDIWSTFLITMLYLLFIYLFIYLFTYLFIYLFVFPGLVTISILHTEKLHCCRNITS